MNSTMSDSAFEHYTPASQIFRAVSFLPIAVFAENLRVQPALLSCLCSKSAAAIPLTGCIKDLSQLWFLNFEELFGGFHTGWQPLVSSVRNGNSFSLANRGFLKLAGLLEEPQQKHPSQKFARPVTVGLTFVLPTVSSSTSASSTYFWLRHCFNMINLTLHLGLVVLLGFFGLYLGSLLMACMAILDILQMVLRHATSAIFSLPRNMDGDALPMSAKDPIDVHVIAQTTNASHVDVLVGYSIQLHALTNIGIQPSRPRLIKWVVRTIDAILVVQAAVLTCLSSGNFPLNQSVSSAIWLSCYLFMLLTASSLNKNAGDLFLENQPGCTMKVPTITFSKRTAALAFISMLPVDQKKGIDHQWMDGYIPDNQRRKDLWRSIRSRLLPCTNPSKVDDEECVQYLIQEVQTHLRSTQYKVALDRFNEMLNFR